MYSPNNLKFRIVSSNAIAQYKLDQAADFNELINNPDYAFTQESRETLLLNYEIWFRFIVRMERILIKNQRATEPLGQMVGHFVLLGRDTAVEIEDVMQSHPDLFKSNSKLTVKKTFLPFMEYIFNTIAECESDNMYIAFPKIVIAISGALHNMLFILQEIESLKNCLNVSHDACGHFLSYTAEARYIQHKIDVCPTFTRASLYKNEYGTQSFILKNYTTSDIYEDCHKCIEQAKEDNITISSIDECIDPHEHF